MSEGNGRPNDRPAGAAAGGGGARGTDEETATEQTMSHRSTTAWPGLGFFGVGILRALVELGAGIGPIGTVRLLGSVRAVGHLGPVARDGVRSWRIRGSRLRLGPVGVLGTIGRFGLPAGERWRPRRRRPAAPLGLVGVVGLLRSLGPVRAVGVHRRIGTVGALGGFRLLGQLGVLGTVGFVGHPAGRPATVGRLGTVRSTGLGLVLELGARIRFLRVARPLAPTRPVADPGGRNRHRRNSEEGRAAGAARSEEVGPRPHRLQLRPARPPLRTARRSRPDPLFPRRSLAGPWPPAQPVRQPSARVRASAARPRRSPRGRLDPRPPVRPPLPPAPLGPNRRCRPPRRGPARPATACDRRPRLPVLRVR